MIAAPITIQKGRKIQDELNLLLSKGFARVLLNGEVAFIEELLNSKKKKTDKDKVEILIDRTAVNADDEDTIFQNFRFCSNRFL
jgi:excinuclease ABC subunit A